MESNLDDEYYQKYIQYKHKYNMLKQFKNNNFEGGGGFLGSSNKEAEPPLQNTNEEASPLQLTNGEAQPLQITAPASDTEYDPNTDGTYLVFGMDMSMIDTKYEIIKQFSQIYHNDKQEKDGIPFVDKQVFKGLFSDNAYILVKTGKKYTYTIISDRRAPSFAEEYTKIKNLADNLSNIACECKKSNQGLTIDNNLDITNIHLKTKYDEIIHTFNEKKKNYIDAENGSENVLATLLDLKTDIIQYLNEPTINLYKENDFEFTTPVLNVANNKIFLTYFNNDQLLDKINAINTKNMNTNNVFVGKNNMNMIIKIKSDDEPHYKFDGFITDRSVSNTEMYTQIETIVVRKREVKNADYSQIQNPAIQQYLQNPYNAPNYLPMQPMQPMQPIQQMQQMQPGYGQGFTQGYLSQSTRQISPMQSVIPMQNGMPIGATMQMHNGVPMGGVQMGATMQMPPPIYTSMSPSQPRYAFANNRS
jgi:hypothetical protein